jgi:hypothetical protein
MPEDLRHVASPVRILSEHEYLQYRGSKEEAAVNAIEGMGHPITEGMQKEYLEKYGCTNWYDWAKAHWDTKWGIYQCRTDWEQLDRCTVDWDGLGIPRRSNAAFWAVHYQSAWSATTTITRKLSALYPDFVFVLSAVDEGGNFHSRQTFAGGQMLRDEDCGATQYKRRRIRQEVGM